MRWQNVLRETTTTRTGNIPDADVTGVAYDSRRVLPGDIFVAMRGGAVDGNRFLDQALAAGAAAILTDAPEAFRTLTDRVPCALVDHGRRALAQASAAVFHHPERDLKLTAVTGTNGKTTTAFLTESLLLAADRKTLLIGTIETHLPATDGTRETRETQHTTPESRDLYALFREVADRGATEAVMEMSSHALDQERVFGLPVDVAIFTNLTQDHLDYHGTMEAYGAAKARLFQGIGAPPPRVSILNADDPAFPTMAAAHFCDTRWTYSLLDPTADFHAAAIRYRAGGTDFLLNTPYGNAELTTALTGRVNVYNLLAAAAAALARGLSFDDLTRAIPDLRPVPGRFETVPNTLGLTVVVDYAHTDDALRNLITLARELAGTHGRVLTLFGCGGDRDRTKRPKMGAAADEGSDIIVVTSDNPRSENPAAIVEDILPGIHALALAELHIKLDRRAAIEYILRLAGPGDIVLLAGKGHEKTQTTGSIAAPFDDTAVAAQVLDTLQLRSGNAEGA